jgi:hypothetical protein
MHILPVRFAFDFGFPTEWNLRCSNSYIKNYATKEKQNMGQGCGHSMYIIYGSRLSPRMIKAKQPKSAVFQLPPKFGDIDSFD